MVKATALDHLQVAMPRGEEAAARAFYGTPCSASKKSRSPNFSRAEAVFGFAAARCRCTLGSRNSSVPQGRPIRRLSLMIWMGWRGRYRPQVSPVLYDSVQQAGSSRAFTHDPFGNRVELVQPDTQGRDAMNSQTSTLFLRAA